MQHLEITYGRGSRMWHPHTVRYDASAALARYNPLLADTLLNSFIHFDTRWNDINGGQ